MSAKRCDIYWAAGFLEGEGCFRDTGAMSIVAATQKDPESLHELVRIFGGSVRHSQRHKKLHDGSWSHIHFWQLTGENARKLAILLRPLLSRRRQSQIDLMLDKWKARRRRGEWIPIRRVVKVSNDGVKRAIAMLASGMSYRKVAAHFKVTPRAVLNWKQKGRKLQDVHHILRPAA